MDKVRINPLILISLSISTVTMGMFASRNYTENNIGLTITFLILCMFFIALTVSGIVRNRRLKHSRH